MSINPPGVSRLRRETSRLIGGGRIRRFAFAFGFICCLFSEALHAADPPYTCVAFSRDGSHLVAGSQKGVEIFLWPSLDLVERLPVSMPNINDVAFSADGSRLAVGGGVPGEEGLVELYSWPEKERYFRESCCFDLVYAVAFNADRSLVAAASLDNTAAVLDVATGHVTRYLEGHSKGLTAVDFLPDGKSVVTGAIDQSVRLWDPSSERPLRSFNNHTKEIHDLAASPQTEGLPMVVSTSSDRTVRLWQPTIGRMVRFARLDTVPLAVSWFPDGQRVAVACDDGSVSQIEIATAEVAKRVRVLEGWAYAIAIHPNGRELAVGGSHGQLKRLTTVDP